MKQKNEKIILFDNFPLINVWYVIFSLVLILLQIFNIIDWNPIWLLFPIWVPLAIAFGTIFILYCLKAIFYILDFIYRTIRNE